MKTLLTLITVLLSASTFAGPCDGNVPKDWKRLDLRATGEFFKKMPSKTLEKIYSTIETCSEYQRGQTNRNLLSIGTKPNGEIFLSFQHDAVNNGEFLMCEEITLDSKFVSCDGNPPRI
jgi:hypothetical protein